MTPQRVTVQEQQQEREADRTRAGQAGCHVRGDGERKPTNRHRSLAEAGASFAPMTMGFDALQSRVVQVREQGQQQQRPRQDIGKRARPGHGFDPQGMHREDDGCGKSRDASTRSDGALALESVASSGPPCHNVDKDRIRKMAKQTQAVKGRGRQSEHRLHCGPDQPCERLIVSDQHRGERPREDVGGSESRVVQQDARVDPVDEGVPKDRRERRERDQRQAGDVRAWPPRRGLGGERLQCGVGRPLGRPRFALARLIDTRAPAVDPIPRFRHATAQLFALSRRQPVPAPPSAAENEACQARSTGGHSLEINQLDGDRMLKRIGWFLGLACLSAALPAGAQPRAAAAEPAADEGIPVQSDLVRAKCGSCHRSDDKGRMSRISYRRATPENWERTIKRMVALNHATLEPADARTILKYLADHQGLAPEEERPIAFEAERRMVDYTYDAPTRTRRTRARRATRWRAS